MEAEKVNKIISEKRGDECLYIQNIANLCVHYNGQCVPGNIDCSRGYTLYASSSKAWSLELYKWIEDQGSIFLRKFISYCLWADVYSVRLEYQNNPCRVFTATSIFEIITLTAKQKAIALAMTILETEKEYSDETI